MILISGSLDYSVAYLGTIVPITDYFGLSSEIWLD